MTRFMECALVRTVRQIARFATGSMMAYGSEIGCFALLVKVVFRSEAEPLVAVSMAAARAVSILVQYSVNRYLVFRSRIRLGISFLRYLAVNLGLLGTSYLLVRLLRPVIGLDITLVKMGVDLVLFFVNFTLNRWFVFGFGRADRDPTAGESRSACALRTWWRPQRHRIPAKPAEPFSTESEHRGPD